MSIRTENPCVAGSIPARATIETITYETLFLLKFYFSLLPFTTLRPSDIVFNNNFYYKILLPKITTQTVEKLK